MVSLALLLTVAAAIAIAIAIAALLALPMLLILLPERRPEAMPGGVLPGAVSLIVPVHGSGAALAAKLDSLRGQHWGTGRLELILSLDGPVVDLPVLPDLPGVDCRVLRNPRRGKYAALNAAVAASAGELLLFSDLDARLAPGALAAMVAVFAEAGVGAACARVAVDREDGLMQARYWDHEGRLKTREMVQLGSITASNGTLLAIRRVLFRPIPAGVVDDLFVGLCAVVAGRRFVFVPEAVALMPPPARTLRRVFARQRRIVCRGLNALRHCPQALSVRRHGRYALALIAHKVLRRAFPLALALGFVTVLALALLDGGGWLVLALAALGGLGGALGLVAALGLDRDPGRWPRVLTLAPWALCVNAGIAMGWYDFLRGRRVTQW
ncbi:hypothetical protein MARPU_01415 [Marichromatium purpuratum 984]|uniref:Glycosyltransferase 2-like domain-containing protein n=1 Tax=Marichromatium purpuratum 984 TaxID=765910 RepID=W0E3M0_MARPU|nr:glycosyltransferase [Marichromatium purpuratum]AHF05347.1 hypothetical protein MARPU_01415 [Marichromatium purpuratum 984]